ncbi:MAG: hypothetical protein K0B81_04610 [Candidatus Cloacimonetes bacterium]|nr:hypothetical protein [Candidatus Cloacimonadota bacterium]
MYTDNNETKPKFVMSSVVETSHLCLLSFEAVGNEISPLRCASVEMTKRKDASVEMTKRKDASVEMTKRKDASVEMTKRKDASVEMTKIG